MEISSGGMGHNSAPLYRNPLSPPGTATQGTDACPVATGSVDGLIINHHGRMRGKYGRVERAGGDRFDLEDMKGVVDKGREEQHKD